MTGRRDSRRRGGDTTIATLLADPVAGPLVRSLTLGELTGSVARPAGKSRGRRQFVAAVPNGGSKAGASRRTAEGRGDHDAKVLAALKAASGPVAAEDVIKRVGGIGLQFRTSTCRLLASRKIRRTGKARGTRYVAT